MTFLEAQTLPSDMPFIGRVRVSASKYMNYLLQTPTDDPDHAAKVNEGIRIANSFEQEVQKCVVTLMGDPEVLAASSTAGIPDATLSMLVEKTIKSFSPMNQQQLARMMQQMNPMYPNMPLQTHYAYAAAQPMPVPPPAPQAPPVPPPPATGGKR